MYKLCRIGLGVSSCQISETRPLPLQTYIANIVRCNVMTISVRGLGCPSHQTISRGRRCVAYVNESRSYYWFTVHTAYLSSLLGKRACRTVERVRDFCMWCASPSCRHRFPVVYDQQKVMNHF